MLCHVCVWANSIERETLLRWNFKCLKHQEFIYVVCTVFYGSSIGFGFNLYVVSRRWQDVSFKLETTLISFLHREYTLCYEYPKTFAFKPKKMSPSRYYANYGQLHSSCIFSFCVVLESYLISTKIFKAQPCKWGYPIWISMTIFL